MKQRVAGGAFARFLLVLLLAGLAVAGWQWQRYQGFADAPLAGIDAGDSLVVARGDSLDKVLRTLQAQGVDTGDRVQWQVLARQTGAAGKLQVGEYALAPDTSPRALPSSKAGISATCGPRWRRSRGSITIRRGWTMPR